LHSLAPRIPSAVACSFAFSLLLLHPHAQKHEDKQKAEPSKTVQNAAQIELLETSYRFEANGDSRKEVRLRVKINNELGVQQFARLKFEYNRSYQSVEIPFARITHPSGGTADILPGAIADNPNAAVVNYPAYQDLREKSVRILGLAPGDLLEYRVVTTTTHPPLAPDFWLEHSFDRTGVVSDEVFKVDIPASLLTKSALVVVKSEKERRELEERLGPQPGCGFCGNQVSESKKLPAISKESSAEALPAAEYGKFQVFTKPFGPPVSVETSGEGSEARTSFIWRPNLKLLESDDAQDSSAADETLDIEIGRTMRWPELSIKLYKSLELPDSLPPQVKELLRQLTTGAETPIAKTERIYDFVSKKIATVDLPLGATGFSPRDLTEILKSGYATPEDKFFLFQALAKAAGQEATAALIGPKKKITALVTSPGAFTHILIWASSCGCALDPSLEVAPFRALPASYRGSTALYLGSNSGPPADVPLSSMMGRIPEELPFPSFQRVDLNAAIDESGKLTAKVKYKMRGDNELLLRVAFHQTPKEKWKDVAQLLALSDGFRGQVINVTASDPYDTGDPFSLEYDVVQPQFVSWEKTPVRIPAILPLVGLPDPPPANSKLPIELGTPLDVDLHATLQLPPGTTARVPTGTSVRRDYAEFSSSYTAQEETLTATRRIRFLLRTLPADRVADYNAFLHAVQSDQAQEFQLERREEPCKSEAAQHHSQSH